MDVVQYYRALVLGSSTVEGGREDSPKAKCQCAMLEEVVELPLALSITPRVVWALVGWIGIWMPLKMTSRFIGTSNCKDLSST